MTAQPLTQKNNTILVMAGGTGGHIFPGIAVAEYLQKQDWKVHWLGTPERMEAQIVPKHGFDISFINIKGVRHKGWKSLLTMPFKLINAVWQAIKVIKRVKPDVVLGMGGYASAPGGFAAWLLRKPLVLHEQNAKAGLTNRVLAKFASKVLCAFPGAFDGKIAHQITGNPLRSFIGENHAVNDTKQRNILVVGGSLGALALNQALPEAIKLVNDKLGRDKIQVWHQSGQGKHQALLADYQAQGIESTQYKVTEFIDDMGEAYQWADLVICRAGALTVSEVAMAGKAAVFIPLPHAVDDHQTHNANYLVNAGAAKLVAQKDLSAQSLADCLESLLNDIDVLSRMGKAAKQAARGDATQQVADICAGEVNS